MQNLSCPNCQFVVIVDPSYSGLITCPNCHLPFSTNPDSQRELAPGTRIAGFEIVKTMGHGARGTVYFAIQLSMARNVALKILPSYMTADQNAVKEFIDEARAIGKLNHSNIIVAFDAGTDSGYYYIATTFVDGYGLDYYVDNHQMMPEKEALKMAVKIADALAYAWDRQSLCHRDIKPGNIMIDRHGEPYLLDFGLALNLNNQGHISKNEFIDGSPWYMSPEQWQNKPLNWQTDLYSLGVTLYQLIVGVPPYDNPDLNVIGQMHINDPFPFPYSRNPYVVISPATIKVLEKMMAKLPEKRYQSWQDCKNALQNILNSLISNNTKTDVLKKHMVKSSSGVNLKSRKIRKNNIRNSSKVGGRIFLFILLGLVLVGGIIFVFARIQQGKEVAAQEMLNVTQLQLRDRPNYQFFEDRMKSLKTTCSGTSYQNEALQLVEKYQQIYEETKKIKNLIESFASAEDSVKVNKITGMISAYQQYQKKCKPYDTDYSVQRQYADIELLKRQLDHQKRKATRE